MSTRCLFGAKTVAEPWVKGYLGYLMVGFIFLIDAIESQTFFGLKNFDRI